MKYFESSSAAYKFGTSNVTAGLVERLIWSTKSVALQGWEGTRNLYLPNSSDAELFPNATWRLALTPSRGQDDPLFQTAPVRIKPGKKLILEIFGHSGEVESQVRISNLYVW
jgi:hypothetical protein